MRLTKWAKGNKPILQVFWKIYLPLLILISSKRGYTCRFLSFNVLFISIIFLFHKKKNPIKTFETKYLNYLTLITWGRFLSFIQYFIVYYTSTKSWRGYIFIAVCLCVCVSVCVYVSVCVCPEFLWTKFQPNGWTDLDAVFAKWLLTTLARTLLKLVTLGQRSRSR